MSYTPWYSVKEGVKLFRFEIRGKVRLLTVKDSWTFVGCAYKSIFGLIPYTQIIFEHPQYAEYPSLYPHQVTTFWFTSKKQHNEIADEIYQYFRNKDFVNKL